MHKCSMCNIEMDDARVEMGYTQCILCSSEEKVSCHTIYPHKTGCLLYTSPSPRD